MDGCNRLEALWRVVLPLAMPGVVAVGIFQFVGCWNEFMMAITIIQNPKLQLLPVQIVNFMGAQRIEWGPVMAFSVIVAIPGSDFVCHRPTWYRQWDDVWLYPVTHFARTNSLQFGNWRIAHAFGIDRPDAQRNRICRISRAASPPGQRCLCRRS